MASDGGGGGDGSPAGDGAANDGGFSDGGTLPPDLDGGPDDAMPADDGAMALDGSGALDGSPIDAVAFMDAQPIDATVFMDAAPSCVGLADGTLCPGSTDPNQAERCLSNLCVGTYVTPPPVGNNANPGTRALPKATVSAGITVAGSLGALAALTKPIVVYVGVNAPSTTAVFTETVSVPHNVDLEGAYSRGAAGNWTRAIGGNDTRIVSAIPEGVVFIDHASTRANTLMRGFTVIGAAVAASSASTSSGISISNAASPTLDQLTVVGGASPQSTSAAISISLGNTAIVATPLITACSLTGGGAPGAVGAAGTARISDGIAVSRGAPEVRGQSVILGGTATVQSSGVACTTLCGGASAMLLVGDTIRGGSAPLAQGVVLTGDTTNIQITTSTIVGGSAGNGAIAIGASERDGIDIANGAGAGPLVSGNDIVGVVSGGVTLARGVHVVNGSLQLTASIRVVGVVPAIGGPAFLSPDNARGVHCEGDGAFCLITANTLIAGTRGAQAGTSAIGLIAQGRGTVARNQLIVSGDCDPTRSGIGIGARIAGGMRVENNVIIAGNCSVTDGMDFTPAAPTAGGNAAAEIVNNHIDGGGVATSTATSIGIIIQSRQGNASTGVFLNNTILAGAGTKAVGVAELTATADPAVFIGNNVFGAAVLYQDEAGAAATDNKTDITMVNGIVMGPVSRNNISADPLIVGGAPTDYHLQATSPNRAAGQASTGVIIGLPTTSAPQNDYDNMDRPQPANTLPDIGPDERQ